MAEHEWEKREPVWCRSGCRWRKGTIEALRPADKAFVRFGTHHTWFWHLVGYDHLRLRDPALDGADKPTAESEAER